VDPVNETIEPPAQHIQAPGSNPNAEGASIASAQSFRQLFELAPICIFVVDLQARPATILEFNHRAELTYGYTTAEIVGMPVALLGPADAGPVVQRLAERAWRGETVTAETIHWRRDGTRFPVRIHAACSPTVPHELVIAVEDTTVERLHRSEAEAVESERYRLAHEIHDSVAQSLAGLRYRAALWHRLVDDDPARMHTALDGLQDELATVIEDIRRVIFALRPIALDEKGFRPALSQWVEHFGAQFALAIHLEHAGVQENLPAAYEIPLFRVIQEALSNVRQHARATEVTVRLAADAVDGIFLAVVDNGQGFDHGQMRTARQRSRYGLPQMRERIMDFGGTMEIRSGVGRGTELVVHLPNVPAHLRDATGYEGLERRSNQRRQPDTSRRKHGAR
jgi:PAS domain S-box-containing protein